MIYHIGQDTNKYSTLVFTSEDRSILDTVERMQKSAVASSWVPLKVEERKDTEYQQLPDCAYLQGGLNAFSEKAIKALYPLLKNRVEFLPLEFPNSPSRYTVINPKYIFNLFEKTESVLKLRNDIIDNIGGTEDKFVSLDAPIIKEPKVPIFKILNLEKSGAFCTELFVKLYKQKNLTGLKFMSIQDNSY